MRVELQKSALKDLKSLDKPLRQRILQEIATLENLPELPNIKKLTNHYPPFRMRVGEYRVLFDVEGDLLIVVNVKHRSEAYKK
ncbi:MAG: type II toxin-antitoxin system RelE/ParE family toxin [Campylobacterales bacterium]